MNLLANLPTLLPLAIAWAEDEASRAAISGRPLTLRELEIAKAVGVTKGENIRVKLCSRLPMPAHPDLKAAALETGLLGPKMVGLTLGYSVFICDGFEDLRLLAHEFRHVFQYERCGAISDFLPIYLQQIATLGYDNAPFEIDARSHEVAAS